ncbi:phage tail assembly protein [Desulfoluna butyratoxydans]|uniref:Bacteriophage tail protein gp41 putative n=1 Tax=Desulfoluna butyratoxydans TaxID=231438 RepID=A0A4U8YRI8_9BACT|nr:phage tail assembly protein [Desulfoluna butyratoxydans]VFQ46916.1 bacteriophage tail protein gp41 putative [Desulfoluna butyratoxydans]
MEIKLKKAITFEGKEINTINLDLEGLTGEDMAQAEREYLAMGGQMTSLTLSHAYCHCLAARAADFSVETIRSMSARDSTNIAMEVQLFLHGMEDQVPGRSA